LAALLQNLAGGNLKMFGVVVTLEGRFLASSLGFAVARQIDVPGLLA
jgi:hypothetical protein